MSHTALTVPFMNKPPRRHDITIRVAKEVGHLTDPSAFATAARRAAARRNASILSAHTAEEIICVVNVPLPARRTRLPSPWPSWLTRSRPGIRCRHPAGKRTVLTVVRGLVERGLPELVVTGIAGDHRVSHAAAVPGRLPGRCADAWLPAHLRFARP